MLPPSKTNTTTEARKIKTENEQILAKTAHDLSQVIEEAEHIITRVGGLLPPNLTTEAIPDDQKPVIAYLIIVLHRLKCVVNGKSVSKKARDILKDCRERLFGDDALVHKREEKRAVTEADTKRRRRTATIDTDAARRLIGYTLNLDLRKR